MWVFVLKTIIFLIIWRFYSWILKLSLGTSNSSWFSKSCIILQKEVSCLFFHILLVYFFVNTMLILLHLQFGSNFGFVKCGFCLYQRCILIFSSLTLLFVDSKSYDLLLLILICFLEVLFSKKNVSSCFSNRVSYYGEKRSLKLLNVVFIIGFPKFGVCFYKYIILVSP